MVNRFKERNFSVPNDNCTQLREDLDYSFSNFLYDCNKGVTHDFLHTNKGASDDFCRIISDVEICMSNDPSVTSFYPAEYRQSLMNSIKGLGTKSQFSGLSDDAILESGIRCRDSRELDENYDTVSYLSSHLPVQSESEVSSQSDSVVSDVSSQSDSQSSE